MRKQSSPSYFSLRPAPELLARVHLFLLRWYETEQRALPWRATSDPYAILVSEMMLQQTQVERVRPKYAQFLEAFPTLADLARASTAEVIAIWVPLGYNRRAVNLQGIARQVMANYGGKLPDSISELLKLKGIGRYTAGAIACFAYHQQVATVDTNIRRALQRIFIGMERPAERLKDAQALLLAEEALPAGEAYNWNQALMDLGATVCTDKNPRCTSCPLQEVCRAYAEMREYSLFPPGSVARELRKVAEKKAAYQAQPFRSSNRYFRGRVVALLSVLPAGERVDALWLGRQIKPGFGEEDAPWLHKLLDGLARDGLVEVNEEGVRLP